MSENFAALLDESLNTLEMQPGTIVSGVVLDIDKEWATVHVGLKSEGVIPLDEFKDVEGKVDISVGDEIEVALEAVEDGYGETRISREKARKISAWKNLEEALIDDPLIENVVLNHLDDGFIDPVEEIYTSHISDYVEHSKRVEKRIEDLYY